MDLPPIVHDFVPARFGGKSVLQRIQSALLAVLFWSAIVLPVVYLSLLAVGPDTIARPVAVLLLLHILSLVTSHSYNPG